MLKFNNMCKINGELNNKLTSVHLCTSMWKTMSWNFSDAANWRSVCPFCEGNDASRWTYIWNILKTCKIASVNLSFSQQQQRKLTLLRLD